VPVCLALITLCREFLITGMRMVAASKGVVVAADTGGKSKTLTQLIALGFFLAAPMVARDGYVTVFHWIPGNLRVGPVPDRVLGLRP
jgi:phosphatidylglycerophosphate synthase